VKKYILLEKENLTQKVLEQTITTDPREVGDYVLISLVESRIGPEILSGYYRYTADEVQAQLDRIDLGLVPRFKLHQPAETAVGKIPRVAVTSDEGDFNTYISHDFTNNTTWPATDNSVFSIAPASGNVMYLKKAEVQFSHDVKMKTAATPTELYFDTYMYVADYDAVLST
jgi:hypothetical protein